MSAFVVGKAHIDLLVKAAEYYGKQGYQGSRMQWWQVDEDGNYAGWRYLEANEDLRDEYYTLSQLGQILVNENVASVSHRYSEPGRVCYYGAEASASMEDLDADMGELPGPIDAYYMGPYVYTDPGRVLTPGQVFKAIDCLDYQSCEHPRWRTSEAFAFLTTLRETVCRHVAEYEDAPWEFSA